MAYARGLHDNRCMPLPLATMPVVGSLVAVAATSLPVVLHQRDPDVVNLGVGLALLLAGVQLLALAATRVTGHLLVAASVAWFLPDLAGDTPWIGDVLARATLVHVPLLVAAAVSAPEDGLAGRRGRATIAVAVAAAASAVTGGYQVLLPLTGIVVLVHGSLVWRGVRRRVARPAGAYLVGVYSLAAALVGVPITRGAVPAGHERALFFSYGALLVLFALALVVTGPWLRRTAVLDAGADGLERFDRLVAEVTGDPQARVVVPLPDGRWLRLDGAEDGDPARRVHEGISGAMVVSNSEVPAELIAVVQQGLRLAEANVAARHEVDRRVHQLSELRQRLVRVEDEERAALVRRIRHGPLAALSDLRQQLEAAGAGKSLVEEVRRTQHDVTAVAQGLDPLDGTRSLGEAVARLCAEAGASVAPGASEVAATDEVARAVWFACSEALANATKHAPAGRPEVSLELVGGEVLLRVSDRGPGPGPAEGVGLTGVRDRLAAVAGTLSVAATNTGTRVEVRVPTRPGTRHHVETTSGVSDVPPGSTSLPSKASTTEVSP